MGVPDGGGERGGRRRAPPPPPPRRRRRRRSRNRSTTFGSRRSRGAPPGSARCSHRPRVHAQALDEMVVPDVYVQAYAAADLKGKANAAELAPSAFDDLSERYPRAAFEASAERLAALPALPLLRTLDGAQWAAAQGARHAAHLGAAPRRRILRSYALEQERRTMRRIVANAYLVSELRRRRPDAGATDLEICRVRHNGALPLAALEAYSRALCRSCADVQIGARELLKAHARARRRRRFVGAPGVVCAHDGKWLRRRCRQRVAAPDADAGDGGAAAAAAAVEAAAADGAGGGGGGWLTRLRLPRRPRGSSPRIRSTRSRRGRAARRARLHSPPSTPGIAHPPRPSRRRGRSRRRPSGCSRPRGWYAGGPSSRWAIGWAPARSAPVTGRRGGGRRSR